MHLRSNKQPGIGFGRHAVTLIELLAVMAIIALLVSFGAWGMRSAQSKQSVSLARAQVAALAAGIEQFKSDMGYYPPGDGTTEEGFLWLFNGVVKAENGSLSTAASPNAATYGPWVDASQFTVARDATTKAVTYPVKDVKDPWGKDFLYGSAYDTGTNATKGTALMPAANNQDRFQSYVVFSWGPLKTFGEGKTKAKVTAKKDYIEQFGIHPE